MKKLEITWSGFTTPYNIENLENVTTEPGIYLLWVKLKSEKWRCFYVGQAINLKKRLMEHLSPEEENECIKNNVSKYICGFEYTIVLNENNRNNIEKYIYDFYKPECNKISPPSDTPQAVNLP